MQTEREGLVAALLAAVEAWGRSTARGDRAVSEEDERLFNELALRVFRYQVRHNEVYRTFCERRGVDGDAVSDWRHIPAMPIAAFREFTLSCVDPSDAEATFITSGTTESERRGRHFMSDLALYHATATWGFRAHALPDLATEPVIPVLFPAAAEMPNSSLAHFFDLLVHHFGAAGSGHYIVGGDLEIDRLLRDLRRWSEEGRPVVLLGASFSYVHAFDRLIEASERVQLPPGSRMIDTGGFKGRSRTVSPEEMQAAAEQLLGLPADHVLNYYGMTELASQYYDSVILDRLRGESRPRRKMSSPWSRVRIVDPLTLEEVEPGRPGVLIHYDLGNVNSLFAFRTEDMGVQVDDGFQLLGRVPRSEVRGCSIAIDALLEPGREEPEEAEAPAVLGQAAATRSEGLRRRDRASAAWLPGLEKESLWEIPWGDASGIEVPVIDADDARALIGRLQAARAHLEQLPVQAIVERIDAAVKLWEGDGSPYRREALARVPTHTGYAAAEVERALDDALDGLRAPRLLSLIEEELGSLDYLEGLHRRTERTRSIALGPGLLYAVFAGNVPGVPLAHLAHALLLRSALVGKVARGEPLVAPLFCRSLAEVDPQMAASLALTWWPRSETGIEEAILREAGAVIAYGSDAAVDRLRRRVDGEVPFMGYSHRFSFAAIGRERLESEASMGELVERLVADAVHLERQGCVSPQTVLIETGDDGEWVERGAAFAQRVARALKEHRGAPPLAFAEAADLARRQEQLEFEALRGAPHRLIVDAGHGWRVVWDPVPLEEQAEGAMRAAVGPGRLLGLQVVKRLEALPEALGVPRKWLQTAGLAVGRERYDALARRFAAGGVTRVCPLGTMQWPDPQWRHDGRPQLADLIRWVDVEVDS